MVCTTSEKESIWAYLKKVNEEMLKVEELFKSVALEALIRG
jgi:hypothetical protein